jgi:hypothetical protein
MSGLMCQWIFKILKSSWYLEWTRVPLDFQEFEILLVS